MVASDPEHFEVVQRLRAFTEGQRIEYWRRMDLCEAVLAVAANLARERRECNDQKEEQSDIASAKWPYITFIVSVALMWLGKETGWSIVSGAGYLVAFFIICILVQAALNERKAIRGLADVKSRMEILLLHWIASGF